MTSLLDGKSSVNVIEEKLNISETLPSHLLGQFCDSENLNKFLGLFSQELQELESDAIIPLLYERTLVRAEGVNLDNIGVGLSVPREGRSDEAYRAALRVSSLQRQSRGAIDEILELLYYLTGIRLVHHYRGYGYYLQLGFNPTCVNNQDIIDAVSRALPIMSNVQWLNIHNEKVFGYGSVTGEATHPYIRGYGSVNISNDEQPGRMSSHISRVDRDFANSDDPRYAFGYGSTETAEGTEFLRGYQTVRTDNRTTTSAGEIISIGNKEVTSEFNRLQDNPFRVLD